MELEYFDRVSCVKKLYVRALEPVCARWELTRNEMDVLLFLYNNPQFDRAADIVTHRGIAKSHVSLAVQSLEARGYLQRETEHSDRRTVHLRLTQAAAAAADAGREVQQRFFGQLFDGLTDREAALWQAVQDKIGSNIKKMEEN